MQGVGTGTDHHPPHPSTSKDRPEIEEVRRHVPNVTRTQSPGAGLPRTPLRHRSERLPYVPHTNSDLR